MIRLKAKAVAEFMTANALEQRKILHAYKYPDDPGNTPRIQYYREARTAIRDFYKQRRPATWLTARAQHVRSRVASGPSGATRLENNAQAIEHFAQHFSRERLLYQGSLSMSLRICRIQVDATPDLYVMRLQREKLISTEFATGLSSQEHAARFRIVGHMMFEAASRKGMGVTRSDVVCYEVATGKKHRITASGVRVMKQLNAACQNIEGIWPTL